MASKKTTAAKKTETVALATLSDASKGGLAVPPPPPEQAQETVVDVLADVDMGAALDAIQAADTYEEDDLQQGEADFWKPLNPGDSIEGVYLGTDTSGHIKQHLVAVKSDKEKGIVVVKRFNGSMKLSKDIANNGEKYRYMKVTWNGKVSTSNTGKDGRKLNDYVILWGPRPSKSAA